MKSWKTTGAGICAIVIVVAGAAKSYFDGTPIDYSVVIAAVMAGVGLLAARDNDKSSEDVGAK